MESRKLKCKFTRQLFKTTSSGRDLQKTEMSYHQAPSCNIKVAADNYIRKQKYIIS